MRGVRRRLRRHPHLLALALALALVAANALAQPRFLRPAGAPKPVTFYLPDTVSLVKGGPNPEGGKALIEYLLSKPVQTRLVEFFGLPARNDIGGNAQALAAVLKDVEIVPIDWNHVLDKQKEWQDRWRSQVIDNAKKPLELVKPKS